MISKKELTHINRLKKALPQIQVRDALELEKEYFKKIHCNTTLEAIRLESKALYKIISEMHDLKTEDEIITDLNTLTLISYAAERLKDKPDETIEKKMKKALVHMELEYNLPFHFYSVLEEILEEKNREMKNEGYTREYRR